MFRATIIKVGFDGMDPNVKSFMVPTIWLDLQLDKTDKYSTSRWNATYQLNPYLYEEGGWQITALARMDIPNGRVDGDPYKLKHALEERLPYHFPAGDAFPLPFLEAEVFEQITASLYALGETGADVRWAGERWVYNPSIVPEGKERKNAV